MKLPQHDFSILFSGLLILIFALVHPAFAQKSPENAKKVKKIVIVQNLKDENGNVKTIRIEKEGKEADDFEMDKFLKENNIDLQIKEGINKDVKINVDKNTLTKEFEKEIEKNVEVTIKKEGDKQQMTKRIIIQTDSSSAKRPFLGVELNENIIENVVENSPAERDGLKAGDKILAINTDKVSGYDALTAALSKYKPEETITIQYEREGKVASAKVTLAKRQATNNYTADEFRMMDDGCCRDKWGTAFKDLKDRPKLGVEIGQNNNLKGALVTKVYEKSGAADAGLQQGDIIYEMDGKPISDDRALTDLVRSHKGGDSLKIKYRRDGEKRETEATLSKTSDSIEEIIHIFKDKNGEATTTTTRKSGSGLQLENYEFYPNPTQNSIQLKFSSPSSEPLSVRLIDANGKEIYREDIKDFNRRYDKAIDLAGKPEGVYVLNISQGGQVFSRQLVYAKK
jgi:predicted metalloprotease with PDZ domain